VAAAEVIRSRELDSDPTLIGEERLEFYSRPGLAYYLTGEVRGRDLQLGQARGLHIVRGTAIRIDPAGHVVFLESGKELEYEKLLIATGSRAMQLKLPGADLQGVFTFNNFDDAQHIIKLAGRSRRAVITGGGITALEVVEGLVAHRVETHYIMRGKRYWHNVLDEVESAIVEEELKTHGVVLHHSDQLKEILGHKGKVTAALTEGGQTLPCEMVGVAVGVQPRLELARDAGLETDRGILVNEYLRTTDPDIYAAGDVAQVYDPATGKYGLESLWGKAIAQGRTAGANMIGAGQVYEKGIAFNVTRLAGLTTTIIGTVGTGEGTDTLAITRGESETWRFAPQVISVQREFAHRRTRIMMGDTTIVGAVVMGDQTLSQPLTDLIEQKVDITPIRDRLTEPGANVAEIVMEFWENWRKACAR